MPFESIEQAEAWAEANGGEQGMRVAIGDGRFGNNLRGIEYAKEWLRQREKEREKQALIEEQRLRAREVRAAEASAKATQEAADAARDSARSAKDAAKWAMFAVIIAVVAAIVAVAK